MFYRAEEKTIQVFGSPMTYVSFGRGVKQLVIIPGLSLKSIHGSAPALAWMYRLFSEEYRIYVFDRKEALPEPCTVSALADDVAEAMRQLKITKADVIGISQGGMIAQYLALHYPELVRKLALGVTLSRANDTLRTVIDQWVEMADKKDYKAIVQSMLENMYSEQYVQKYGWLFPIAMKTAKLVDPERFIQLAKACLTCDTYEHLNEIQSPVLVLGGKEDKIVTARASEEIAEKLSCPIYMYDGLGHSAYEEGKDFNQRIYDFLKTEGKTADACGQ